MFNLWKFQCSPTPVFRRRTGAAGHRAVDRRQISQPPVRRRNRRVRRRLPAVGRAADFDCSLAVPPSARASPANMKLKPTHQAAIHLALFAALIVGGVAVKRVWDHPEFMMLFHLPATVFLVLGGIALKKNRQQDYAAKIAEARRRLQQHSNADEDGIV